MERNCKTCPFLARGYVEVRGLLELRALGIGTPICHSTGPDAITKRVVKEPRACRGARDLQLKVFHGLGVIDAPTDEAWDRKVKEMGLG
jgi:hypothetical protein